METSLIQGPTDKVDLDFEKDFPVKISLILHLSLTKIGCLTQNLKDKMEVILLWLDLLL